MEFLFPGTYKNLGDGGSRHLEWEKVLQCIFEPSYYIYAIHNRKFIGGFLVCFFYVILHFLIVVCLITRIKLSLQFGLEANSNEELMGRETMHLGASMVRKLGLWACTDRERLKLECRLRGVCEWVVTSPQNRFTIILCKLN